MSAIFSNVRSTLERGRKRLFSRSAPQAGHDEGNGNGQAPDGPHSGLPGFTMLDAGRVAILTELSERTDTARVWVTDRRHESSPLGSLMLAPLELALARIGTRVRASLVRLESATELPTAPPAFEPAYEEAEIVEEDTGPSVIVAGRGEAAPEREEPVVVLGAAPKPAVSGDVVVVEADTPIASAEVATAKAVEEAGPRPKKAAPRKKKVSARARRTAAGKKAPGAKAAKAAPKNATAKKAAAEAAPKKTKAAAEEDTAAMAPKKAAAPRKAAAPKKAAAKKAPPAKAATGKTNGSARPSARPSAASKRLVFPIRDYDGLTAKEVLSELPRLSDAQLRVVFDHERTHKARKTVLKALEGRLPS
jgi:hypothetical protein